MSALPFEALLARSLEITALLDAESAGLSTLETAGDDGAAKLRAADAFAGLVAALAPAADTLAQLPPPDRAALASSLTTLTAALERNARLLRARHARTQSLLDHVVAAAAPIARHAAVYGAGGAPARAASIAPLMINAQI